MGKYIITAQNNPLGGGNPEFAPDPRLQTGIQADGFLLMTMENDKPKCAVISGLTTLELARLLADYKSEAGNIVQQAIVIAEGLNKAMEIAKEAEKRNMAKDLVEMLKIR